MARAWTRFAVALALTTVCCSVGALDATGKQCPCAADWTCDPATSTCVQGPLADASPLDSGSPVDTGGPDAPAFAPEGDFVITSFGPSWRGATNIDWEWEIAGDAATFAEYELIVGNTEQSVIFRDPTTTRFGPGLNRELGSFAGGFPFSAGEAGMRTKTDRHTPASTVFARVIVRDLRGRENVSPIVSATTRAMVVDAVVFDDAPPNGARVPDNLELVSTGCHLGAGCLLQQVDCGGPATCALEIGVTGTSDLKSTMTTTDEFNDSFVMVAVRGDLDSLVGPRADVALDIGEAACRINGQPCHFHTQGAWSFRGPDDYRIVEVPLSALLLDLPPTGFGRPLKFNDLSANGLVIRGIEIEGTWRSGKSIHLDRMLLGRLVDP